MDASLLRPLRNFLGLRLLDVSRATSVAADRLSAAERGLVQLEQRDFIAVRNFLLARLAAELCGETRDPDLKAGAE